MLGGPDTSSMLWMQRASEAAVRHGVANAGLQAVSANDGDTHVNSLRTKPVRSSAAFVRVHMTRAWRRLCDYALRLR